MAIPRTAGAALSRHAAPAMLFAALLGTTLAMMCSAPVRAAAAEQIAIATVTEAAARVTTPAAVPATYPPPPAAAQPLHILGKDVQPTSRKLLYWTPSASFDGTSISRGVVVVNGAQAGPTLCLTGVIHGDEHNGLEIIRRVLYGIDPKQLTGIVIGVPIVNLDGFRRGTRYLPDRRDLNRYFPGKPQGSAASRLAFSLFRQVIVSCDYLIDIHTGSFHRTNLPQLRADLTNLDVLDLSRRFGSTVIVHNRGAIGTLRRAATDADIPAVTLETGEPLRIQERDIRAGVDSIHRAMWSLSMYQYDIGDSRQRAPVYFESRWVRVSQGGVLISGVHLGDVIEEGASLGTVIDPVTNRVADVTAPFDGRVLGMALNQVVLPGYAAFHIGIDSSMENAKASEALERSARTPSDRSGSVDDTASAAPDGDIVERENSE